MRFLSIVLLLSSLTACGVKVPQYEAAKGFVGQFRVGGTEQDERQFMWTARIGDEGRLMRLHQEAGLFVFASAENDAIAFDGWQVRSLVGFGLDGMHRFTGVGPSYAFDNKRSSRRVTCSEWLNVAAARDPVVWEQQCDAYPINRIELDRGGDIAQMRFVVDSQGRVLVLERLSAKQGQ